jgi:hypothetical protein
MSKLPSKPELGHGEILFGYYFLFSFFIICLAEDLITDHRSTIVPPNTIVAHSALRWKHAHPFSFIYPHEPLIFQGSPGHARKAAIVITITAPKMPKPHIPDGPPFVPSRLETAPALCPG